MISNHTRLESCSKIKIFETAPFFLFLTFINCYKLKLIQVSNFTGKKNPKFGKNYPIFGKINPKRGKKNPKFGKNYPKFGKINLKSGKNYPKSSKIYQISGKIRIPQPPAFSLLVKYLIIEAIINLIINFK